jgi:transposase-like protein
MTLADRAAITGHDGQVTSGGKPGRPKRRTFTAVYKARILAAYDALPEGSPERGALLRKERIYHSHLEDWRRQQAAGSLEPGGKEEKNEKSSEAAELARLRAENKKLKAKNDKLTRDLGKTKTALDIAGKAFALLEDISSSADSGEN